MGLQSPPAVTEPLDTVPLCVDLDGTLIKTDVLWESLVKLLRQNPLHWLAVPFWLLKGRAHLKAQLATRVALDAAALPYNEALLSFLRTEKQRGRRLVLVTAADLRLAQSVADHVRLFDEVLASDGRINLRGKQKGATLAQRFGKGAFDYAGNSAVDLPVWEQARQALVVNGTSRLAQRAAQCGTVGRVFEVRKSSMKSLIRALRPHQWVKNLIIFVPLVASHQLTNLTLARNDLLAFAAFSLCASAVYILNDLLDVDSDRHHPTKRLRPFASGDLAMSVGLVLFPLLLAASALLTWTLSWSFAAVLGVYVLLTTLYSWRLKQVPLVDVFCLTGLYTIRLIGGHEATGVAYSFWLLVFSMFIFLSLALVKRFVELAAARQFSNKEIKGRGYAPGDAELVTALGSSSGYLSVLVLALYVNSQEVRVLYHRPILLLLICPAMLYWISRVWLLAHRGQMHDDPIVFAIKDRVSYLIAAIVLGVLWLATGR